MPTPTNKAMYNRIKSRISSRLKRQGKRWSARASQELVNKYKKAGGGYSGSRAKGKLTKWKMENWKSISPSGKVTGGCGSSRTKSGKPHRCLPAKKAASLTKSQRAKTAQKKVSSRKKVVSNTKAAKVRKK